MAYNTHRTRIKNVLDQATIEATGNVHLGDTGIIMLRPTMRRTSLKEAPSRATTSTLVTGLPASKEQKKPYKLNIVEFIGLKDKRPRLLFLFQCGRCLPAFLIANPEHTAV